jgi:hypothetical protein
MSRDWRAVRMAKDDYWRDRIADLVMPFVHRATGMPLDVVLAGSGLEDEFLDRARTVDLGGTTVPMIDSEDLLIAKILAGRSMMGIEGILLLAASQLRKMIRALPSLLPFTLGEIPRKCSGWIPTRVPISKSDCPFAP